MAARLGSPLTYDRRGEVIWYDLMGSGVAPYVVGGAGTGNNTYPVNANVYNGGLALALIAGSTGGAFAQATKYFSPASLQYAGLEVAVSFASDFDYFYITLGRTDGALHHKSLVRISFTNKTLDYWSDAGAWVTIAALHSSVYRANQYQRLKLVSDLVNDHYVRVLYEQTIYSLKNIDCQTYVDTGAPCHYAQITHVGRAANNDQANIGVIILTGNEP